MAEDRQSPTQSNPPATSDGAAVFDSLEEEVAGLWNRVICELAQTGGTNTITATASPTLIAITTGMNFRMKATGTNTGAVTINVDSKGAKSLLDRNESALAGGEILSGTWYDFHYDGTNFILMNESPVVNVGMDIAIFSLSRADGVAGGSTTSGSYGKVPINTEVLNDIVGCSINTGTNVITLPPGDYLIFGVSQFSDGDGCMVGMYDEGAADFLSDGTWAQSISRDIGTSAMSSCVARLSLSANKDITLRYRVDTSSPTDGFGFAVAGTELENYGYVMVQKIQPISTAERSVDILGVNTNGDTTNRLSVYSNNALFDAILAADGGDGDFRHKINKEAAGDTGSVLWQTGYSGRAEAGLLGNDDWTLRVSPDNFTTTYDVVVVDKDNGFPQFQQPVGLPSYTVAGVPTAATFTAGMIYVTDETGGAVPAFSDGTNWRRVTDRAIVS